MLTDKHCKNALCPADKKPIPHDKGLQVAISEAFFIGKSTTYSAAAYKGLMLPAKSNREQ
jgi:hypothetical protein